MSSSTQRATRIGDQHVTTDQGIDVLSPYDGRVLGVVPSCGASHVQQAVSAAADVFASGSFPTHERVRVLDRAAAFLAESDTHERFAQLLSAESAKPITTARGEVDRAAQTFGFAAAEARTFAGEMLAMDAHPAGDGRLGFVLRVPIGIVGAISPFNFPLNLVVHKVAPAIAAGCPVVLKPASQTPLTALALADLLLDDCGLPPGWLSVVTGSGSSVGDPLVDHDDVKVVTFTGSPDVGWSIRKRAPRKHVALELGNNSPLIVEPDADLDVTAAGVAGKGYSHAGQSCISVQRVFVHEDIADEFERRLAAAVAALIVGDPADEDTQVSSLIDEDSRNRVVDWIGQAVDGGARIVTGGDVKDGILQPTLLADVEADMKVADTEVFGPVVGLQRYTDFDDALRRANDTRYGLHAGVMTRDLDKALKAARTLDFGGVIINDMPTWRADQMPYGGVRDSGNTREGPAYAIEGFTERRAVVIRIGSV